MIDVSKEIKVGDTVFIWYSPFKVSEKKNGNKIHETEYKVCEMNDRYIKFMSSAGYTILFTSDMLRDWEGRFRKA